MYHIKNPKYAIELRRASVWVYLIDLEEKAKRKSL
jgi:hypothetical protein